MVKQDYQKIAEIGQLSFYVLPKEQIRKLSVVKIDSKTLYDIDARRPSPGGPLDLRLGVSMKTGACQTCGEGLQKCPGHFGCIDLVLPVYHIGFLKNIVTILNSVCKSCGSLLIGFNRKLIYRHDRRVETVRNECKKAKSCPRCGRPNGTVKKNSGFRIVHELRAGKEVQSIEINPLACLNIFKMIDEDDYEFLGLKSSPESFVVESMLVPPACIRPSVDMQDEGFNEDDLTVKLSEIVNTNKMLDEGIKKGGSLVSINETWDMLQLQVALFMNSDIPTVNMQATPIRGIVQRLKGKQGRFRCNLSGKRVDFTGRTVISPDPNLSIEEVGVPIHIAKTLTIPERVTRFNIGWLQKLVSNGLEYPGANYVISKDANGAEFKRFLMYGKNKGLNIGDVVERHLLDGDVLLFNRQPSLHRMSIMAHRARIHNHKTLRFNECNCASYNADFDGDEMNIHLPQTLEARSEALNLMGVRNNICTARNGQPLVACTQDFITGTYIITDRNVLFDRQRFSQLCSYAGISGVRIRVKPAIMAPVELFTGKQLFEAIIQFALYKGSLLYSENAKQRRATKNLDVKIFNSDLNINLSDNDKKFVVNLDARNRSYKDDTHQNDGHVLIINNRFIKGRLDKAIIGGENRTGSLIYQLHRASKECAVVALNSISKVSVKYLAERGFSIGLDDVYPSKRLIAEKCNIVQVGFKAVNELIAGGSGDGPGRVDLEMRISSILSKIRDDCGNACVSELSKSRSPIVMAECGSKGSKINVSQMVACVGQQIISGKRITEGMHDRTLPHFEIGTLKPAGKGFVLNSFFTGLRSYEFFFHAVSGREGLVDTAVKTAETGYIQRRLIKALEDLSVMYNDSVRNSYNDIVQFQFGEDSFEPLRNEEDDLFKWTFALATAKARAQPERVLEYQLDGLDFSRCLRQAFGEQVIGGDAENQIIVGILEKMIAMAGPNLNKRASTRFLSRLIDFVELNNSCFYYNGRFYEYFKNALVSLEFAAELCRRLSSLAIEPGAAVGAIAAQSIGEPGTQMTLKTFHFAGVASMNITLGIPRLQEIINAASSINTPIINCRLAVTGLESAKVVKGRIERVVLGDIVKRITDYISNDGISIVFEIDSDLIRRMRLEVSYESIAAVLSKSIKATFEATGNGVRLVMKRVKPNSMFQRAKFARQAMECRICGLENVSRATISRLSGGGPDEHELLVEGFGMEKIFAMPGVNPLQTVSNNIIETFQSLGIEAARSLIISEIEYTMGKHGITIDPRHIMLLADMMCFRGEVLGITRFGIEKMRSSTLALASFERTSDYLFSAAAQNKEEKIIGVSESIIMGVPISLGTGSIQLYWKNPGVIDIK